MDIQKTLRSILRFISVLFEYLKRGQAKNCARYFEIHKYAFLCIWKAVMQKTVPGILRLVSMLFLIFENGITKISAPDILGFYECFL